MMGLGRRSDIMGAGSTSTGLGSQLWGGAYFNGGGGGQHGITNDYQVSFLLICYYYNTAEKK